MTAATEGFRDRYAAALAAHVRRPDEEALRTAYELGREAVSGDLTVLDLAVVHHDALASALAQSPPGEGSALVVEAGCNFFVESLSAFEMVRRGFREAREAALLEQRHAAILRQLSNFLADASVALDAAGSMEEMLQLVAEQARELVGATRCFASLTLGDETPQISAVSGPENGSAGTAPARLSATLIGWEGRKLGTIEVSEKAEGEFTEVDAAVLVHVAQMASAAVERARPARGRHPS